MPVPRVIFDRVRDEINRELAEWVGRLVAELRPQRILLFGSAARDEAGEDSDIDLCVIAETELGFFERIAKVKGLYKGKRMVEVVVYTPEEWQQMLEEGRDFVRTIASEGRVLYEAVNAGP